MITLIKTFFCLIVFTLFGNSSYADSNHPSVKFFEINGKSYRAIPINTFNYCPPFDISLYIRSDTYQLNCLEDLFASNEEVTKTKISRCFKSREIVYLFDQLQLIGVSKKCLDEKVEECRLKVEYEEKPSTFMYEVIQKGYQHLFNEDDSLEICKSLIY